MGAARFNRPEPTAPRLGHRRSLGLCAVHLKERPALPAERGTPARLFKVAVCFFDLGLGHSSGGFVGTRTVRPVDVLDGVPLVVVTRRRSPSATPESKLSRTRRSSWVVWPGFARLSVGARSMQNVRDPFGLRFRWSPAWHSGGRWSQKTHGRAPTQLWCVVPASSASDECRPRRLWGQNLGDSSR